MIKENIKNFVKKQPINQTQIQFLLTLTEEDEKLLKIQIEILKRIKQLIQFNVDRKLDGSYVSTIQSFLDINMKTINDYLIETFDGQYLDIIKQYLNYQKTQLESFIYDHIKTNGEKDMIRALNHQFQLDEKIDYSKYQDFRPSKAEPVYVDEKTHKVLVEGLKKVRWDDLKQKINQNFIDLLNEINKN